MAEENLIDSIYPHRNITSYAFSVITQRNERLNAVSRVPDQTPTIIHLNTHLQKGAEADLGGEDPFGWKKYNEGHIKVGQKEKQRREIKYCANGGQMDELSIFFKWFKIMSPHLTSLLTFN